MQLASCYDVALEISLERTARSSLALDLSVWVLTIQRAVLTSLSRIGPTA
jgi:hypothetical protein